MLASKIGHIEIVQILLQGQNIKINQQDEKGWTALILASQVDQSREEFLEML